ncbi:MAG: lecithin retinol acyltransferase family protein [Bacillota bacterium]|nr:lecithin retinol acyltransferase family protein [Bacillota bacterium]
MRGDIVFVTREPLLFKNIESRINKESCIIDKLIARIVYYRHYGIQVNKNEIIHFYCPSIMKLKMGRVEKISIEKFTGVNGILEYENNNSIKLDRDQIVERAEKHLDTDFGGYKITSNNCEHFSNWCYTGEKMTKQNPGITTYKSILYMFGGLYYFFIGLNVFSEFIKKNEL